MDERDTAKLLSKERSSSHALAIHLLMLMVGVLVGVCVGPTAVAMVKGQSELVTAIRPLLKNSKYVDLTHPISPKMPRWPGFQGPMVSASKAGIDVEGFVSTGDQWSYEKQGFVATSYVLPTDQLGTQLDPPAHWNNYGATIDMIPASISLRELVVIDVHEKAQADPWYSATVEDVLAWERRHGQVPAGSVVMVRTDWGRGWPDVTDEFPSVSLDALKFLHNNRSILFHGHEPLDTDSTANLEGEAWLMHHNFLQAEGVANLHEVAECGCLVTIGFAKFEGGTGGYARYVAICPDDGAEGGDRYTKGAALQTQPHPLRRQADGVMRSDANAPFVHYCNPAYSPLGCPLPVEGRGDH